MPARLSTRRQRRVGKNAFRLKKTPWRDPYPAIPGTEPEKRLFEALMRRHVYFIFQGDAPDLVKTERRLLLNDRIFKPDFILPEYKVIIDPFGVFHHSLPEAIKRDAWKSVVYRAAGYAFYHPWWSERGWEWQEGSAFTPLGTNTLAVLARIPELRRPPAFKLKDPKDIAAKRSPGYRLGKNLGAGANSVALANATRKRPKALGLRVGRRRNRRR